MRPSYLVRVGKSADCSLNVVILNGDPTETISHHTATAAKNGERWGCIGCRILSALVERDHCGKVLSGAPESSLALIRAGVAILAFLIGLDGIAHLALDAARIAAGSIAALV